MSSLAIVQLETILGEMLPGAPAETKLDTPLTQMCSGDASALSREDSWPATKKTAEAKFPGYKRERERREVRPWDQRM